MWCVCFDREKSRRLDYSDQLRLTPLAAHKSIGAAFSGLRAIEIGKCIGHRAGAFLRLRRERK